MTEWRTASKAEFDAWHAQYKAENGYPIQGRNAATGDLVDVGWTTEYTSAEQVTKDDVRFVVDAKDVPVMPGKLSSAPARKVDGSIDVVRSKSDQAAADAVAVGDIDRKP